jgi:hypothetical protein
MRLTRSTVLFFSQLFGPSIIVLFLLGGISAIIQQALADSNIQNEILFYDRRDGFIIDNTVNWLKYRELDVRLFRVSKTGLRMECFKVVKLLGNCRVFVDQRSGIMWIEGLARVRLKEPEIFVYYWVTQLGEKISHGWLI